MPLLIVLIGVIILIFMIVKRQIARNNLNKSIGAD